MSDTPIGGLVSRRPADDMQESTEDLDTAAAAERLDMFLGAATLALVKARAQEIGAGQPKGKVGLAIVSTQADGSGCVAATFDADPFLDDLATVLSARDATQ